MADDAPMFYDPTAELERRHGAYLPHWKQAGRTYFVTFRLADSLPASALDELRAEREAAQASATGDPTRLRRQQRERVEAYLDAGVGDCLLARPACAELVANSLRHFDGQRYRLWAWCVMPNHVHAVVTHADGHALAGILHSWKSFTAHRINKLCGREGTVWQAEAFDHLVRHGAAFERYCAYIVSNPESAGLVHWPWHGSYVARPSRP